MKLSDTPAFRHLCLTAKARKQLLRNISDLALPRIVSYEEVCPEIFTEEIKNELVKYIKLEDYEQLKLWLDAHEHIYEYALPEYHRKKRQKENHGL